MDQGSPMTNRSAPLACLSPREQARRLAALYPSEAVRWHMLETLTNLQDYAAMRGRTADFSAWGKLADAVLISLTADALGST
jgi:hypothetical protein